MTNMEEKTVHTFTVPMSEETLALTSTGDTLLVPIVDKGVNARITNAFRKNEEVQLILKDSVSSRFVCARAMYYGPWFGVHSIECRITKPISR